MSDTAREATDQAAGVASTAAEQTGHVATRAVEGGKWVAAVGQDEARQVASTAAEQVGQVAGEVGTQARNLIEESKTQLHAQAQTQTDQIATKLRTLGDQVQALVEGRTEDAGPLGDYARQAAQTVSHVANRVEDRGFDGIVEDVQRFARRRPGTFLLGAAVAGFGIGRLLRAGAMSSAGSTWAQPDTGSGIGERRDLAAAYPPYGEVARGPLEPVVDLSDDASDATQRQMPTPAPATTPSTTTTARSPMGAPADPGPLR